MLYDRGFDVPEKPLTLDEFKVRYGDKPVSVQAHVRLALLMMCEQVVRKAFAQRLHRHL
jgi:hypothetical protein